jgi:hypothetical protein
VVRIQCGESRKACQERRRVINDPGAWNVLKQPLWRRSALLASVPRGRDPPPRREPSARDRSSCPRGQPPVLLRHALALLASP